VKLSKLLIVRLPKMQPSVSLKKRQLQQKPLTKPASKPRQLM